MDNPLVSVIMPIRNEEAFIARSLGAVLQQDYPAEKIEILIADGQSDDGTLDLIRRLPGAERVRITPNPRRIQSAGLNAAIPQTRGDIIVRVDGHTVIAPDYVRQCVIALRQTGAQNVGGAMDPVGLTPMGRAIAAAGKSRFAVPSVFHVSQTPQYTDTVYMGAFPRPVFETVGLYNEQFVVNEDYELNHRIHEAGGKIYFTPAIRSTYYGRQTLLALARQYFRYGMSKVKTLRQHPESLKWRQVVAPAFVAALIGGAIMGLFSPLVRVLWLLMIAAYFGLALIVSMGIARRQGWTLLLRLPLVFLSIHLAWGVGFWVGLTRSSVVVT